VAATSHGNPYEYRMVADDGFGYLCDEDPTDFTGWRAYTLQGEVNDGNAWYAHQGVAGHAGLFSTARELNALLQVLLSQGMHGTRRVLSREVVRSFLTPDTLTGNGVGWAMAAEPVAEAQSSLRVFSHSGFTGTYVAGVPELDLAIVFLSNRQNAGVDAETQYPNAARVYGPIVQRLLQGAAGMRKDTLYTRAPPALLGAALAAGTARAALSRGPDPLLYSPDRPPGMGRELLEGGGGHPRELPPDDDLECGRRR
jgi:CubicO group peptidase (beta-lactamase class C family)